MLRVLAAYGVCREIMVSTGNGPKEVPENGRSDIGRCGRCLRAAGAAGVCIERGG